jgi:hypothetical protein
MLEVQRSNISINRDVTTQASKRSHQVQPLSEQKPNLINEPSGYQRVPSSQRFKQNYHSRPQSIEQNPAEELGQIAYLNAGSSRAD